MRISDWSSDVCSSDLLGVDPVALGARMVDGRRFAAEAAGERGPLLVGQCDRPHVISDLNLSVEDGPTVTVLQILGLPEASVQEVAWTALDRAYDPDHPTSHGLTDLADTVTDHGHRLLAPVRPERAE